MGKLIRPAKRKGLVPLDAAVRILELRGRMGMTQVAFAQKLGVSHISVCRWETGQNRPSPVVWRQIAELEATAFSGLASRFQDLPIIEEEVSENLPYSPVLRQPLMETLKLLPPLSRASGSASGTWPTQALPQKFR